MNLLDLTECKAVASSTRTGRILRDVLCERIIENIVIPKLAQLIKNPTTTSKRYPFFKTFEEGKDDIVRMSCPLKLQS